MTTNQLLQTQRVAELKETYLRAIGAKPKSKLKKSDLITALESDLSASEQIKIRLSLKDKLPDPKAINFDRKLEDFVRRFVILQYGIESNQQRLSMASRNKYWMFRCSGFVESPPECKANDERVERFDSVFWKNSPVPCHRHDCSCDIDCYSKRTLIRKGLLKKT